MIDELAVTLVDRNSKRAAGTVRVETWDRRQRTRRALKCLAGCWVMSVVTLFIPLAHFVLVPGFFLGGLIGAWWLSQQPSVVVGGESVCPACGKKFDIVRGPDRWPLTDQCGACQMPVTIEKIANA